VADTDSRKNSEICAVLRLKKGVAKPLHGGHPWVFAEAILKTDGPKPGAGEEVRVIDERGTFIGRGFYSPDSAIAVRLITRADLPISSETIAIRINEAYLLRRDILGLGIKAASAPVRAQDQTAHLSGTDQILLQELDGQLAKIQTFAAQYGMDPLEETAEIRKRRDALLQSAREKTGSTPAPQSSTELPDTSAYRLINSEGDGLGGLTVDVYGEYLSVQIGTAGMERRKDAILDALQALLVPKGILDRSDARNRQLEKLPPAQAEPLRGAAPTDSFIVTEHGIRMHCDLRAGHGQKTGLFVDQRENRRRFGEFSAGRNVLDVFSYSGGFSLHAARGGAHSLTLIESSEEALKLAEKNLESNGVKDADLINAEWTEGFKHLREQGRQFELIVLDPPKFARARENVTQAISAYRDLSAQAVRLLAPGGILFTCSCSGSVSETDFERAVAAGIRGTGRRAALIEKRGAAPDHPIPPGFEQGRYLKCLILQVV
jgi:23S rRNA (cytosine1962-C5)-methyltransferase